MIRTPNTLRVGHSVVKRNDVRRKLLNEVETLISKLEWVEKNKSQSATGQIQSYEGMIQERCDMLMRLSG